MVALISLVIFPRNHPLNWLPVHCLLQKTSWTCCYCWLRLTCHSLFCFCRPLLWMFGLQPSFFLSSHPLAETQKKPTLHHNDFFFFLPVAWMRKLADWYSLPWSTATHVINRTRGTFSMTCRGMVQPRLLSHVILLLSSVVGYCGDRVSHESPTWPPQVE